MVDPKNNVNISGGIVADPEVIETQKGLKIVKIRLAVDYAASAQDDNNSGFFDVTFFASDDNRNSSFVLSQVEKKNFKKGTVLQILGRLVQERWEKEGSKGNRVVIVAESITYAGRPQQSGGDAAGTKAEAGAETELPTKF